jgi:tetratricopeptide (TPR) repeat protein
LGHFCRRVLVEIYNIDVSWPEGTFRPEEYLTRGDFAVYLLASLETIKDLVAYFADEYSLKNTLGTDLPAGEIYLEQRQLIEAVREFGQAILKLDLYEENSAYEDLAKTLTLQGYEEDTVTFFWEFEEKPYECTGQICLGLSYVPDYPKMYFYLGDILHQQGHLDLAVQAYRAAIGAEFIIYQDYPILMESRQDFQVYQAYYALAKVLQLQGNLEEACKELGVGYLEQNDLMTEEIIFPTPTYSAPLFELNAPGSIYSSEVLLDCQESADFDSRIEARDTLISENHTLENALLSAGEDIVEFPISGQSYITLIQVFRAQGLQKHEEVVNCVVQYWQGMQCFLFRVNQIPIYCEDLPCDFISYSFVNSDLGMAFRDEGLFDLAIAAFRQVSEDYPIEASLTRNAIGEILQLQGDLDAALVEYQAAIKLEPNNREASINLEQTQNLIE